MQTFEDAMSEARRLVSRKRDLGDIDIAEVARRSGLLRFVKPLQSDRAQRNVRIAIGQVRAARLENAA